MRIRRTNDELTLQISRSNRQCRLIYIHKITILITCVFLLFFLAIILQFFKRAILSTLAFVLLLSGQRRAICFHSFRPRSSLWLMILFGHIF